MNYKFNIMKMHSKLGQGKLDSRVTAGPIDLIQACVQKPMFLPSFFPVCFSFKKKKKKKKQP